MGIGVAIILFILWVIANGIRSKEQGEFGKNFVLPLVISIVMIIFIFGGIFLSLI